jgi:outer membrane receptor for ferrienterochelin and colicin
MTGRLAPSGDVVRGHVLVNSTLTSPIRSRHLQVAASVYNLFDAQYGDPGSREHRQSSIQQDGRTVQIKLTTGF